MTVDRKTEVNQKTEYRTFSDRTNPLLALVQMIRAIAPFIWAIVIFIVIISLLGQFFIPRAFAPNTDTKNLNQPKEIVVQKVDWSAVDRSIVKALNNARESAKISASGEL